MSDAPEISEIEVSDPDCLFCRIVSGQIQADIVAEGEHVIAFRDVNPVATVLALDITRSTNANPMTRLVVKATST